MSSTSHGIMGHRLNSQCPRQKIYGWVHAATLLRTALVTCEDTALWELPAPSYTLDFSSYQEIVSSKQSLMNLLFLNISQRLGRIFAKIRSEIWRKSRIPSCLEQYNRTLARDHGTTLNNTRTHKHTPSSYYHRGLFSGIHCIYNEFRPFVQTKCSVGVFNIHGY